MWADTVPPSPELTPLVEQIRSALPALPSSWVPIEALSDRARRALDARPELADQIGTSLDAWIDSQSGRAWFGACDGRHVVIDTTRAIDDPRAMRMLDTPPADAGRSMLVNEVFNGGPPPPIVLDGIESGASIAGLCRRFPRLPSRAWARIYAVEPDPCRVFDALSTGILDDHLGEDRLRFFVGPACKDRFIEHLGAVDDQWSKLTYLPGLPATVDPAFYEHLLALTRGRADEYSALCASNNAAYAQRDRSWWRERYRRALDGDAPPLRALVVTTRYSTYVQHASRDIANALNARGFQAQLRIESDDSSLREGLSMARAINTFEPDAIIVTNYARSTFGDSAPSQIPFICWIQDNLSHLYSDDFTRSVDALTMLVGNIYTSLVTDHGVPESRCLTMGVPASEAKFSAPIIDRPGCDLFIATNHGESPEAFRDRLRDECAEAGGPPELVPEIHERIEQNLDSWRRGHLVTWLVGLLGPVYERHNIAPSGTNAGVLLRDAAVPMVNRMLRHRLLGWAADLAETEGVRLRIAGRGWEDHPRLAKYSIGEVPHGPALRDEYQNALLTLQTSAASLMHQRIHECLLAGSMPALMLTGDDLTPILRPARASTMHGIDPTCSTLDNRWLCVRPWDDPIIAHAISVAQRIMPSERLDAADGSPDPEIGPDIEARALRTGLLPWRHCTHEAIPQIPEAVPLADQMRFIDAISPGMFWDRQGLQSLLHRAQHSPAWRNAQIDHARSLTRRWFTYEHAASAIIETFAERL